MKHYVYIHFKTDTLEPFYIGKGSGVRYKFTSNRSIHWKRIRAKHGFTPDILEYFHTHEEAIEYEKEMISFFRKEYKLCNHTDGGEGTFGMVHSEETKRKISENASSRRPEVAAKISKSKIGFKFSDESKAKMSAAKKGKTWAEISGVC